MPLIKKNTNRSGKNGAIANSAPRRRWPPLTSLVPRNLTAWEARRENGPYIKNSSIGGPAEKCGIVLGSDNDPFLAETLVATIGNEWIGDSCGKY